MSPNIQICPTTDNDCIAKHICNDRNLCCLLHCAPIDTLWVGNNPALHFVGFRGEEYHSAVQAFGLPDFIHKVYDRRAIADIALNDTVVFAKYHDCEPSKYSYDDSNQADDPAAMERLIAATRLVLANDLNDPSCGNTDPL